MIGTEGCLLILRNSEDLHCSGGVRIPCSRQITGRQRAKVLGSNEWITWPWQSLMIIHWSMIMTEKIPTKMSAETSVTIDQIAVDENILAGTYSVKVLSWRKFFDELASKHILCTLSISQSIS